MHQIESKVPLLLALAAGLIGAFVLGQFASGMFGNPISAVAPVIAGIVMIVAVVNYRAGFFCLIFLSGYLDLIKRLLFLDSNISMEDVTKVLSVAPIVTVGLFFGAFIPVVILRKRKLATLEVRLFVIAFLAALVVSVGVLVSTKDFGETVSTMGQSGIYLLMVPIVYSLLANQSMRVFEELISFVLAVFIPVAIYGLWQVVMGYNQLEINYMMSGLTITGSLLAQSITTRPFSTLNSPQAFGTMMFFLMVLALYRVRTCKSKQPMWVCVFLVFLAADLFSTTRGATLFSLFAASLMFWFASKRKTVWFYVLTILPILFVIVRAQWILDNLVWFDSWFPHDSDYQKQMLNIQTFSERLKGYINVLTNPEMWTFFGHGGFQWGVTSTTDETYNHDALSQFLLKFGAVGVFCLFTGLGSFLWQVHKRILSIPIIEERYLASTLTVIVIMFLVSTLAGPAFQVFPLNLFTFCFLGLICAICFRDQPPKQAVITQPAATRGSRRSAAGAPHIQLH